MSGKKPMQDEDTQGASGSSGASLIETRLPGSTLGNDVQAKIGQHLRAMYDDVVRQGVPDRFLDLLSRLDETSASGAGAEPGKRDDGGRR